MKLSNTLLLLSPYLVLADLKLSPAGEQCVLQSVSKTPSCSTTPCQSACSEGLKTCLAGQSLTADMPVLDLLAKSCAENPNVVSGNSTAPTKPSSGMALSAMFTVAGLVSSVFLV